MALLRLGHRREHWAALPLKNGFVKINPPPYVQGHKFKNPSCPLISYNKLVCSPFITSHGSLVKDQKIILSPQLIYSIIEKEKTGSALYCVVLAWIIIHSIPFSICSSFFLCVRIFGTQSRKLHDETTQSLVCQCVCMRIGCRVYRCGLLYVLSAGLF